MSVVECCWCCGCGCGCCSSSCRRFGDVHVLSDFIDVPGLRFTSGVGNSVGMMMKCTSHPSVEQMSFTTKLAPDSAS